MAILGTSSEFVHEVSETDRKARSESWNLHRGMGVETLRILRAHGPMRFAQGGMQERGLQELEGLQT